jgi:hypothetical protein
MVRLSQEGHTAVTVTKVAVYVVAQVMRCSQPLLKLAWAVAGAGQQRLTLRHHTARQPSLMLGTQNGEDGCNYCDVVQIILHVHVDDPLPTPVAPCLHVYT